MSDVTLSLQVTRPVAFKLRSPQGAESPSRGSGAAGGRGEVGPGAFSLPV